MDSYTVVLAWDTEWDGYTVSCPAMPGAVSCGKSRDEALANIRESMEGWFAVAEERGFGPVPESPELVAKSVAFDLGWQAEEGWALRVETASVAIARAVAA